MKEHIEIQIGKKNAYGRLTAMELCEEPFVHNSGRKEKQYLCECDCGAKVVVRKSALHTGNTRSCGCLYREAHEKQNGLSSTRLYNIWRGIKKRCLNPDDRAYRLYGGRGIKLCKEWLGEDGFLNFADWSVNNGYEDGKSIDRIDNDGDYTPENCRWTDVSTQSNNRRDNHKLEYNGKTLSLAQWEKETGVRQETIRKRLKMGWSIEQALTTAPKKKG